MPPKTSNPPTPSDTGRTRNRFCLAAKTSFENNPSWTKWRPSNPTSAHWYDALLATNGLDRDHRFVMRCDAKLLSFIPERDACDEAAVLKAFEFLVDEWLVDVAGDLASKCVLVAYALTILERVLFPARPAFLVSAGQRASAMLGYLMEGLTTVVWDNIKNGTVISSKIIEQICTAESHCDRVLGATQTVTAPAYMINVFTGNNVRPAGDLASRCLQARLAVDRPDPQNRPFKHVDPIQWTRDHRGEILKALYTLLLGNPQLDPARAVEPKTRFKHWWGLVGAAVEYASDLYQGCHPAVASGAVEFAKMFDAAAADDDEGNEIGDVLEILNDLWPNGAEFNAADVFARLGDGRYDAPHITTLREFFTLGGARPCSSSLYVGRGLRSALDKPLRRGVGEVLVLRARKSCNQNLYRVERKTEIGGGLFD